MPRMELGGLHILSAKYGARRLIHHYQKKLEIGILRAQQDCGEQERNMSRMQLSCLHILYRGEEENMMKFLGTLEKRNGGSELISVLPDGKLAMRKKILEWEMRLLKKLLERVRWICDWLSALEDGLKLAIVGIAEPERLQLTSYGKQT